MLKPLTQRSSQTDSHPHSIVVAGFNDDNLLDIAVANAGSDNIGILLAYGNNTFASQFSYSTGSGSNPYSLTVGDFNNDHRMDIAVANFGTHNVGIFLGLGNGFFTRQTTFSTGPSRPRAITVGDFNSDNKLDIAVANYGTSNIGVLLGLGNGTFSNQTTFSTGYDSLSLSIAVGDFNNDNKLDIAVVNNVTNNVGIFLGHGNGSFEDQMTFTTGIKSQPYSIALADLNNDTHLDITVSNFNTHNVGVFLGHGDGSFEKPTLYSTGNKSYPVSVAISDFNNDNKLDIVVANSQTNNIGLFFGYGNGTFATQVTYSVLTGFNLHSIVADDFNNDNILDIVIASYATNDVNVFFGSFNSTFSDQVQYSTGDYSQPSSVVIDDFNNDDKLDIAVANRNSSNLGIFLGYGDGSFSTQMTYSTGSNSNPRSITVGDFNGDGLLDIAVANEGYGNVGVFLQYRNGTFMPQKSYSNEWYPASFSVASCDFDNDGRLDIAVANRYIDEITILFGDGDGNFSHGLISAIYSEYRPFSITVGDFNNDDRFDIAVANELYWDTNNVGVFLNYGNRTFSGQISNPTEFGSYPRAVTVGDFNNDGKLDIAVANFQKPALGIFLGNGDGTFSNQVVYAIGGKANPISLTACDFNNDSRLDIVVANSGVSNVAVFLGKGKGIFSSPLYYSTGNNSQPYSVATGDLNNDNRLDIVVANSGSNNIGIFLGLDVIKFTRKATYSTGFSVHPEYVVVYDFNNDTQLDIVVANSNQDNVGVLLGYTNVTFSMETTYSTGYQSRPISLAVGDFNNDDRQDISIANANSDSVGVLFGYGNGSFENQVIYPTGSGSNPRSIATGDFNNDSRLDIVVVYNGINSVGVLLRYDDIAFESPVLYSTDSGSTPNWISFGDLNNDNNLDIAIANYGTHNIGVLYGYGNGSFKDPQFYPTGSGSRPYSIVVCDFNNDSFLDIVFSDNFGNRIGILFGIGNGSFSTPELFYSGGTWPETIAVADFDNDGQLDIAVNIEDNVYILLQYHNGRFASETTCSTGHSSTGQAIAIGDFNNDGWLDMAIATSHTNNVGILLGTGNGSFLPIQTYPTGLNSGPRAIAVADFNGDGQLDIAVANHNGNNLGIFFGYRNGSFMPQQIYPTGLGSAPISVTICDFNNDGRLDIAVANFGTHTIGIFLGYKDGMFFNQKTYPLEDFSSPVFAIGHDFNHDGQMDIVVANKNRGNVGVMFGYVSATFRSLPAYPIGNSSKPNCVTVGDFDNDSRLDIAIACSGSDNVMILLGSGIGTFSSQTNYSTGNGSYPYWIRTGDFNNDSRLDIVVANYGANNIGVLLGHGNGTFSSQTTYFTGDESHPYSVVVGDFDNDKQMDIAVANYGTNNVGLFSGYGNGSFAKQIMFSTGFDSHPFAMASGDVNKDNTEDVIIVNNGYGNLVTLSKLC
ncbi:unnamed protein product [Rotaria sp. Silwood1]|nr:unnamed protein product [Rotaria sp. Silwood1]